jgi:hypothetical protein
LRGIRSRGTARLRDVKSFLSLSVDSGLQGDYEERGVRRSRCAVKEWRVKWRARTHSEIRDSRGCRYVCARRPDRRVDTGRLLTAQSVHTPRIIRRELHWYPCCPVGFVSPLKHYQSRIPRDHVDSHPTRGRVGVGGGAVERLGRRCPTCDIEGRGVGPYGDVGGRPWTRWGEVERAHGVIGRSISREHALRVGQWFRELIRVSVCTWTTCWLR